MSSAGNQARIQRLLTAGCNQDEVTELLELSDPESYAVFGRWPTRAGRPPTTGPSYAHLIGLKKVDETNLWRCVHPDLLASHLEPRAGKAVRTSIDDVLDAVYVLAALRHG